MPIQPPRIGRTGGPKVPWAITNGRKDTRKRGRAGQRERAQVLAEEPLCRICAETGRTTASAIVDHIKPLAWGGRDDRLNKQGLCKRCHDAKSAEERKLDAEQRRRFQA